MEVADFKMDFEENQQAEADKRLMVIFYKDVVKNELKSTEAGRPIFDEVDLVKIITPGQRDSFVGDANEHYQQRFPQQWARYKSGRSQELSGTPLNQLPWMSISQIAEFNAVGCHTVEQLVGMSDAVAHKFMGFQNIRQRAELYLEAATAAAPALRLQNELQKRDEQIAELQRSVELLVAANKALTAKQAATQE